MPALGIRRKDASANWAVWRRVTEPTSPGYPRISSGNGELAFLGHPFESFGRALDPVLAVIAVGRQQTDHLVGAAGGRTGNIAGSKIHSLSNAEFVLQRPLHHAKMPVVPTVPLQCPGWKPDSV